MQKKVLTLTVSKEWFDLINSGVKNEEYREIKPYWISRLLYSPHKEIDMRRISTELGGRIDIIKQYLNEKILFFKDYTHVLFINGYGKDKPRIEKEIASIEITLPKKGLCPDKWLEYEFFTIKFK